MRRRQTRESERGERQVEKERDREISERDREHALALWSIRPCKPKAQSPADSRWPPSASRAGSNTHMDKRHTAEGATRRT